MKKDLRILWISLLLVSMFTMFSSLTFGQETTGNIEVTVKDEADAVVPNATVTVEGVSSSFKRTVTTDDSGYTRIVLVPPGVYSVTVAAISGFAERRVLDVSVGLGKSTPVTVTMGTAVGADVTVTATGLDITDVGGNTTLSAELVELIPKGINFSTILKYSPATRPEPRSGQFQIDGASGAENTFIVDGQEVTDISSGFLNRNVNLPLSILQETQVKTTGFEAEFGGALGGVINMVTKSGSNDFHGEFGVNLRNWRLEPTPSMTLVGFNTANGVLPPGENYGPPGWYPARRSPSNEYNPTATLLGPIWKDHVWFSAAYAPQIFTNERELFHRNLRDDGVLLPVTVQNYSSYRRAERVFGRIDASLFDKLNLNSTVKWSPEINRGAILGYTSELATSLPCLGALCGADYYNQTGGRLNSLALTGAGSYLVTDKLIVSARIGHYFLNNKLGTYGTGTTDTPTTTCARRRGTREPPGGTQFPPGFGCVVGENNGYPATFSSLFDSNVRDQIDADAIYSFELGGRHEIKGGYQRNAVTNDSDIVQNDAISLYWGRSFIVGNRTTSMLEEISGVVGLQMSPTALGAGSLRSYSSRVNASSTNQSYYIQDRWQPTNRLTLNLGLRLEDERVPSPFEGVKGLTFGWESKIAPRLGASYDLTGNGRTKVFGFYGLFYDRFKLGGPGRTFAASEAFFNLYFEILPGDTINTFNRASITGGNPIPLGGGECPTNTTDPIFGRVRCILNNNVTGVDDENLDPNTKPFQQREVTFGVQHQMWKNYMFSARYSRKQVINAIEDASIPLAGAGEEFFITGNPGKGLIKESFEELGLIAPEAQRQYDLLELKLDRRFANNYFFSINYSLSRLYGNYSGLISSDEEGTRNDPNVQRVFDSPAAGFTAAGGPDNGRLATDRPHVLKAFGTYTLGWDRLGLWKNNSTDFQAFYTISSGSQITTFIDINGNEQIIMTRRGDQGRTPVFSQTDFAIRHNIKFGRDGRYNLKFDADIINLFNQSILLNKGANPSGQSGNLITQRSFSPLELDFGLLPPECIGPGPAAITTQACWAKAYRNLQENGSQAILDLAQSPGNRNPLYNAHHTWQARRNIRYGVTFEF